MMSFFRRFAKSPLGLGVFALVIVAFIVTLYEGQGAMTDLTGGGGIATIGGDRITEAEMARRVQNDLEAERRAVPTLDMTQYIAAGGVERSIDLAVNGRALEEFARSQGMVASDKLVDGAIASIPAFAGPTGQFDRQTYLQLLSARKVTEKQLREDLAREALVKALVVPASAAARVPVNLVVPYAALLLEARSGNVATLPSSVFADTADVADAEVRAFYTRNQPRYTIPERRVVRYAAFDRMRFAAASIPTDAEVQRAFDANAGQYAARERRAFTQLIAPTQAVASDIAGKVRGGQGGRRRCLCDAARERCCDRAFGARLSRRARRFRRDHSRHAAVGGSRQDRCRIDAGQGGTGKRRLRCADRGRYRRERNLRRARQEVRLDGGGHAAADRRRAIG